MQIFNTQTDNRKPKGWEVLALFFMSSMLVMVIFPMLSKYAGGLWSITATNVIGFLLVPMFFVSFSGYDMRETFRLKRPSVGHLLLTTLMVFSAYWLMNFLLSLQMSYKLITPEEINALGKKMEMVNSAVNLGAFSAIVLLALLPAVVEEFFFRGVMLAGLENAFSKGLAILVAGMLFGVLHLGESEVMMILGIVLAYIAVKGGSIFLAVYGHFLFNLISVILMLNGPEALPAEMAVQVPPVLMMVSSAGLIGGILLFGRSKESLADSRL
ncbi:MAG: CPBP family intramembrane metalloprotease [Planctomycetes bacterium]|nr:CPBP family intramembrane metalloprotease [Planctomycetota bacterium]